MKFRSLLPPCSATIFATTDDTTTTSSPHKPPPPPSKPPFTITATATATATANSPSLDTTNSSGSSLYSNLSLQTLPSIPSLQNLSPETLKLTVSHCYLTTLKPYPAAYVSHLAVNNHLLYAASGDRIHVFDTTSFSLIDTFTVNDSSSGSVKSLTFHNGKVFTSHHDSKIRVWRLTEHKRHKHAGTLPTVEDRLLRSLFHKNYVNVRRRKRRLWIEHYDAVSGLSVINDNLMCSISWDTYLKIWRTSDLRCVESIKAHDDAINAVVVAGDGTIYTGSADRRIKVWRRQPKHFGLITTLEKHRSAVNALALSSGGSVLFSGACDRSILVWEKEDSSNYMVVTGALRGHSKAILCLINVSDLLFSGSGDGTVRIWQRGPEGVFCCLSVLDGHKLPIRSLVVVVDSDVERKFTTAIKVFGGSFEGEVKIWKVEVFKLVTPITSHLIKPAL